MQGATPSCVLLVGIPASGKSSLYRARFADTHVRLNQDMPRTAARVPDAAVRGMGARLELPSPEEGYDALYFVRLLPEARFDVQEWRT